MEELRIRNGHDNTITERLEVIKRWIDPVTIIILRSRLTGHKDGREDLATYHLIFPFIIGQRKLYSNIVKKLKDQNDGLYKELMWRIDMDQAKKDEIIKYMDTQVLENGAIRGYLQDKWDSQYHCPCE